MTTRLVLSVCAAFAAAVSFGDTLIPLDETGLGRMRSGFGTAKPGKSIDGNALRVGGVEYGRGVGTHAPSAHRVAANGNALSFSAMVGVDDECGGKGSVVFRILADGTAVAEVAAKGGEAAKQISADLAGAKRIVLEVTDGGDGMHFDHADWCDAKFVFKDGTKPLSAAEMTRQLGILTPKGDGSPRINAPARYGVRPGRPIIFKIPVSGDAPLAISLSGLPEGARFDPATRVVSGAVEKRGEYPVAITAKNAKGVAEKTMTLVVGDKIALTPPMGWNSWNAFAGGVSDAKMRTAVDKIVELGLDAHGYSYVNIDDFWQKNPQNGKSDPTLAGPERNADGTIAPNARFPDMKALAD
ncbi:MAG: NPCBM/NEW2 domain-containing protein, partial [Kiritimatiellae bacterium]|nr:NPCBM/NEW2 domain-containing protein [Kiritimatiellia bacterium]